MKQLSDDMLIERAAQCLARVRLTGRNRSLLTQLKNELARRDSTGIDFFGGARMVKPAVWARVIELAQGGEAEKKTKPQETKQ